MPNFNEWVAGGATALTMAMGFLWLLITERVVPKGRLDEVKAQLAESKQALTEALGIIKAQNDGVEPLVTLVKDLIADVKALLARWPRR